MPSWMGRHYYKSVNSSQPINILITINILVVVESLSHVQLLRPHATVALRLLCPGDSPGKNTGVGCRALL